MAENSHKYHRKRLRKELLINDFPETVEPHKVIEALLFYGVPRKDTNPIAHELIDKFGSIYGILEADAYDLLQINGMTENSVTLIKLILPLMRRYQTDKYKDKYKFCSIEEIGEFLKQRHSGYRDEVFMVTTFTTAGEKIGCDIINKGDMNTVSLSVKAVVKTVLKHNAPCVIISHNHNCGTAMPSKADIEMTQSLQYTLEQMGVRLLDHIIIAKDDFISMALSKEYRSMFTL